MHYLRLDLRKTSLKQIVIALDSSIKIFKDQYDKWDWYDSEWLLEDTEPVFGLALIAFQNYINGSIHDFPIKLNNTREYYCFGKELNGYVKTKIELIVGLANYFKHKGEDGFFKGTRDILEFFNLTIDKDLELHETPIFKGMSILSEKWDLIEIQEIVEDWREQLWVQFDKMKKQEFEI